MRAPFPHALSIGTDICHARRILDWTNPARFEAKSHGLKILKRVFHQQDWIELQRRYPWWQRPSQLLQQHGSSSEAAAAGESKVRNLSFFLAGRWAAKEAAKKAWRADLLGWKDMWIETPSPAFPSSPSTSTNTAGAGTGTGTGDVGESKAPEIICRLNRNDGGWVFDQDDLARLAHHAYQPEAQAEQLNGEKSEKSAEEEEEQQLVDEQAARLSISHDGEYAIATVLATPLHPDILAELKRRQAEVDLRMERIRQTYGT